MAYQGQETQLTPKVRLVANESDPQKAVQDLPATLRGGKTVSLITFDPTTRKAILRVDGLNLPADPAKAVVTVGLKPGIMLVWLGIVIGTLGGLIALLRRTLEGQAWLSGQRVRLLRRLGGLTRSFALRMSRQPTAE